jgi:hypothetical protein
MVLGIANVVLAEPSQIARAFRWYLGGLDLADAIHLAGADDADRLATFDGKFIKHSAKLPDCIPVVDI